MRGLLPPHYYFVLFQKNKKGKLNMENTLNDLDETKSIGERMADLNYESELGRFDNLSQLNYEELKEVSSLSNTFEKLELSANIDLAEAKLSLVVEGSNKPIDASMMQMFIKREFVDFDGNSIIKWENITPKTDTGYLKFSIYINDRQTFKFDIKPGIGKYTAARIIFFADGWKVLADQIATVIPFEIVTDQVRIKKPIIEILEDKIQNPNSSNKLVIPYVIKFPANTWTVDGGWWAMAKGGGNGLSIYKQPWIKFATKVNNVVIPTANTKIATGPDAYWYNEGEFTIDYPELNGIYNIQFGLFDNAWKEAYNWIWPGIDIEVGGGSWITKCPENKLPPRLRVKNGQFVKLDGSPYNFYEGTKGADGIKAVRGASWGNAYGWTRTPEYNRSGYFSSLRYLGHRICRFLFDPDQYTSSEVYRHRILDSIGKILSGGLYPLVGPHNMHVNVSTPAERDKKFLEMCEMIANDWKGLPIMYAIASEPKELTGGWNECKPLWEKAAHIIRNIDPDMFIVVPCHGYSKTSTAPEAGNLIDETLVDAYSYHPYNSAKDVIPFMKPLLDTGRAIIVEEYGCGNVVWQKSINIEMQKISKQYPNLLAFLTWAWTKKGQDACPMVENGDLANIVLTEVGKMQAMDIAVWDSGKLIDESGNITPPSVDSDGNVVPGGGTGNTSGTGSTSGGNVIITNTYTKTQIDEMFISKLNILKNEIYAKYDSINKNLSDKLSTLETQLNLLTEKIDSFGNQEIPYLVIQNYLDQLSNCKLLSASFIPNIIVQNNTTNLVINLTAPAPKGGILVYLSATDNRINLPSSILINEGIQNFVFPVAVGSTMNQYSSKVSVTYGGKTIIVNLTIKVK